LGILNEDFNESKVIALSRSEFVSMVVRMLNLGGQKVDFDIPFDDVGINEDFYDDIAIAYRLGLISYNQQRIFRPDDKITISEASKILTMITGYAPIADANGGFPQGFLTTAHKCGILDGVESYDSINGKTLIRILFNTLYVDVYEQIVFGSELKEFEVKKGKSILLSSFGLMQGEGVLTGNSITSLTTNGLDKDNIVTVDDVAYKYAKDSTAFLGKTISFLYKENEFSNEIIFMYPLKSCNNEIIINDNELTEAYDEYLCYLKDGEKREHKLNISKYVDVIYNGQAHKAFRPEDLYLENGRIITLDNNGDSVVDVIFIESYEDYVAKSYSVASNVINLKFGEPGINLNDENCIYDITCGGNKYDINDLTEYDVVSVLKSYPDSEGRVYCKIEINKKILRGTIDSVGDDKVGVDGKEYRFVEKEEYFRAIPGITGNFYLSSMGKIIASSSSEKMEYAYVRDIVRKEGIDGKIELKLLTEKKVDGIYELSDKAIIDGHANLESDVIMGLIIPCHIVKVIITDNGQISHIDTETDGKKNEYDELKYDAEYKNIQYRKNSQQFIRTMLVDSNTKVFLADSSGEEKYFEVSGISALINDVKYTFKAYDVSDTKVAKVIVVEFNEENISPGITSEIVIIDSITKKLDSKNDEVVGLKVIKGGLEIEDYWIDTVNESLYKDLKKGDVMQIATSRSEVGRIISLRKLFNLIDNDVPYFHKSMYNGSLQLICTWGEVSAVGENSILVNTNSNDSTQEDPYYVTSAVFYYIYDSKTDELAYATFGDVQTGDKIFMRETYYSPQECIIIR